MISRTWVRFFSYNKPTISLRPASFNEDIVQDDPRKAHGALTSIDYHRVIRLINVFTVTISREDALGLDGICIGLLIRQFCFSHTDQPRSSPGMRCTRVGVINYFGSISPITT